MEQADPHRHPVLLRLDGPGGARASPRRARERGRGGTRGLRAQRHAHEPGHGRRPPGHRGGVEAGDDGDLRGHLPPQPLQAAHRGVVDMGDPVLRRRPRLLRLPPRPPPDPAVLGDPRGAPQLAALQPLDRAAPGLDAVQRHAVLDAVGAVLPAVDDLPGDGLEPALPVHPAHRGDRPLPAADRVDLQHAEPPPRAPRLAGAVPGPQLRGHPDHLGPHVRHLRARGRAGPLRPDEEHRDVQPGEGGLPRVRLAVARRAPRADLAARLGYLFRGPGGSLRARRRPRCGPRAA